MLNPAPVPAYCCLVIAPGPGCECHLHLATPLAVTLSAFCVSCLLLPLIAIADAIHQNGQARHDIWYECRK